MPENKWYANKRLWFWVAGFFAFLWVMLRSGTNPRRLAYPCQQMAFPLASAWMVAVLALLGGAVIWRKFARFSLVGVGLAALMFLGASTGVKVVPDSLPVWEVDDPVSEIMVMDKIPSTSGSLADGDASVPDEHLSDPAMDTLLMILEARDVHLYRTTGNPEGIVGADNVVIIKGNFQWNAENGTNSDRIKGLVWQILNHPDGFTGEIIICDNTQNIGTGINDNDNNADDPDQSVLDVVACFQAKGYPVYVKDWVDIWMIVGHEYSTGEYDDGYIYEEDSKITYPKFRSPSGDYYISLKNGIWDPDSETYDAEQLCIIDFPVLKAHGMAGATIAVKNWIGVVTTAFSDQRYGGFMPMHNDFYFSDYALVARVMEVTWPRLTIVDATWTSGEGPNNLAHLVRTDMLLASTDPVAPSWYAAKFILTPVAQRPNDSDPDREGSDYRTCLSNWTRYLVDSAGLACSMDSAEISVFDRGVLEPSGITERPESSVFDLVVPGIITQDGIISYSLAGDVPVRLVLVDTAGRVVRTLAEGTRITGSYMVAWDGMDETGQPVGPGVYFVRLDVPGFSRTAKLVVTE